MRRPSFQFYPADWSGNTNLRRCNHEERGIWIDVLCLMHDSEDYGLLRWELSEIAQAIGTSAAKLSRLIDKGVLKGSDKHLADPFIYTPRHGRQNGDPVLLVPSQDGPVWYSSRMVRDEYVRKNSGKATRFQKAPTDPDPSPCRRDGDDEGDHRGDGSSSSSSSTSVLRTLPEGSRGVRQDYLEVNLWEGAA